MGIRQFESSPSYGYIRGEYTRFNDLKLFQGKTYLYSKLKKIKLYYGYISKTDDDDDNEDLLLTKAILGIELTYQILDGKKAGKIVQSKKYTGKLIEEYLNTKELELKENDYFTKFSICFDDIITYIKLQSYQEKVIELGECDEKTLKTINFNQADNSRVIQIFFGFYDNKGLRAVGFRHFERSLTCIFDLLPILLIRYKIKNNDKKAIEYVNNLKNSEMKAIANWIFLPDTHFSTVLKFCLDKFKVN